jgi:hypothetical protein
VPLQPVKVYSCRSQALVNPIDNRRWLDDHPATHTGASGAARAPGDTMAAHIIDPDLTASQAAALRDIVDLLSMKVRRSARPGQLYRRDAHPKHHGCVKAWFTVNPDVRADLRHGLFASPQTCPAWIRFSNGFPDVRADAKRDQRGMAIKLMQVPGPKLLPLERDTQDFILASAPRFFLRRLEDFAAFTRLAVRRPSFLALFFFVRRRYEFQALQSTLRRTDNVLLTRYWSQTPYRLGPHVVKYSAVPTSADPGLRAGRSPDYLRENLAAQLRDGDATFDFRVQVRRDDPSMPIEDATVEWQEAQAPFETVATIRIPRQDFQNPPQMALAEFASFSAWHCLPEHEPLGAINRARREVYLAISMLRRELNGLPPFEPRDHDDYGQVLEHQSRLSGAG